MNQRSSGYLALYLAFHPRLTRRGPRNRGPANRHARSRHPCSALGGFETRPGSKQRGLPAHLSYQPGHRRSLPYSPLQHKFSTGAYFVRVACVLAVAIHSGGSRPFRVPRAARRWIDGCGEAERIKAERVAAYNAKKSAKPKTVAKSVVTLEVKPWDDETDMAKLEESVRSIEMPGLVWGASKLVPIGYGIRKLQITLVVEDELVSLDELQEKVAEFDDYVQSSDVAAMQSETLTVSLRVWAGLRPLCGVLHGIHSHLAGKGVIEYAGTKRRPTYHASIAFSAVRFVLSTGRTTLDSSLEWVLIMASEDWKQYGFAPVPRDPEVLFKDHPTASGPNPKQDLFVGGRLPAARHSSCAGDRIDDLSSSQKELDEQTFNHSNRVFVYGAALVKTHFPEWKFNETPGAVETYALSCLLHDIGTAEKFLATTYMSFEFKGAIVARDLILSLGGPEPEADGVCDAIIRHQDIFVTGFYNSQPSSVSTEHRTIHAAHSLSPLLHAQTTSDCARTSSTLA
ncbi:hypothetical protein NUW54_g9508 [Trametes sanguinea]|uniref:Uncharacterized protein n=1 Tax=Trametes sanguinea TaxID=158606 RepID=A0ACC1P5X0_9APHY|nr:hypothetical protein NUW54_g9508 [Trametes sanguinea]